MPFELDFNICQQDCDQALFSDLTGQYIPNLNDCCKTGYGYGTNPTQDQVVSTEFVFTYPDATEYTVDIGYLPPVNACASFTLSGTQGSVALIADGVTIGSAIFVVDLAQTISDLVDSVNLNNCQHGYQASAVDSTITICDTCGGTSGNGKTVEVCVFMLGTSSPLITLAGGANEDYCQTITTGLIDGTLVDGCFPDGVYTVKMNVTVDDGEVTVYTKTKRFLFDCLANKCLRDLILLSTGANCPCNDKDIHAKISQLRTDIEGACILLEECLYDCANELAQDNAKFCEDVCLDCD